MNLETATVTFLNIPKFFKLLLLQPMLLFANTQTPGLFMIEKVPKIKRMEEEHSAVLSKNEVEW